MTYRQIKWYINQVVFYGKKIKNIGSITFASTWGSLHVLRKLPQFTPRPWDPLFISTTLLHTPIGSLNMVKNP